MWVYAYVYALTNISEYLYMPNIEVPLWSILTELTNGRRRIPVVILSTMD